MKSLGLSVVPYLCCLQLELPDLINTSLQRGGQGAHQRQLTVSTAITFLTQPLKDQHAESSDPER